MSQIMEALNIHPHTFFLMSINVLIVMFVLYKIFFKPLGAMIETRKTKINDRLHQAAMSNKQAKMNELLYEEKLSNARYQAKKIVNEANDSAEKIGTEMLEEARKEAKRIKERASHQVEDAQERARLQVEQEVTTLSIAIAKKILGKEIDPAMHQQLIESYLQDAGKFK